ncbi:MAG TPA: TetR/AcrR family transcriptional regulator [Arachidicoccus sp.]
MLNTKNHFANLTPLSIFDPEVENMGIQERKLKHKESLKQTILDAAKKLFLKNGYQATSIRKIASEIEFSPTTIYLYFKDKAEIAYALHQEGFQILSSQFEVLRNIENPFERVKAMGRAYMRFSLEYGDCYELMFVRKEPMEYLEDCADKDWDEGKRSFEALINNIIACKEAGYFKGLDPSSVAMMTWSTLHGLCMLKIHGHLDFIKVHKEKQLGHIDNILEDTFSTFIKMLEAMK